MSKLGTCELCEREDIELTKHHLIPRATHSKKKIKKRFTRDEMNSGAMICRPCHSSLHRAITEKDLADQFHTIELLKGHESVKKFTNWIKGKPNNFKPKS
jgi:hypothetical protein